MHVQFAPSAYGFSPAVGLLPLLLRRPVPVVTTLHEYGWWAWPARVPASAWGRLERRGRWDRETLTLAPRSAALVCTNPGHARLVRARLGRAPVVVPIGPNVPDAGGDRAAVRRQVRAELGLPAAAPLLVFFGFVHPVKGVRYLLEALAGLPAAHLVVAGGFTSLALPPVEARAFRGELTAHARAVGVADRTTFAGHLPAPRVSRLLTAADAVVLPLTAGVTTKSGALVAALAHGTPTVLTAADDPDPDLVDGDTAVVVPRRRDPDALAAGVARLLDDPALAARVAAGGRRLAGGRSWARVAAAHASLYAHVTPPGS